MSGCVHPPGCTSCNWCGFRLNPEPVFSNFQRKGIAQAFREAKKFLVTENFICHALKATKHVSAFNAISVVTYRLGAHYTLEDWVIANVTPTYTSIQMSDYRARWLDALAKEFSKP